MTTTVVNRPARTVHPLPLPQPRQIEPPPNLPDAKAGSGLYMLLPALGSMSSLTLMFLYRGSQYMIIGVLVLVAALAASAALMLSQRGQAGRARRQHRARYLDYLDELRETLAEDERAGRRTARILNPPPAALFDLVRAPDRRWERRRTDRDFLTVRIGEGLLPGRPVELVDQGTAVNPSDPFMLAEARAVVRRFSRSPGLPLLVPLNQVGDVSVVGPRQGVLQAVRGLLAQVAALHAPNDVTLAVAHDPAREPDWTFLKWLPHTLDPQRRYGQVPARLIAPTPEALAALLRDELGARASRATQAWRGHNGQDGIAAVPRLLVVHDTHGQVASPLAMPEEAASVAELGATVLHLVADRTQEPERVAVRLTVTGDDTVLVEDLRGELPVAYQGRLDSVPLALLDALARMVAPVRLSAESIDDAPHVGPVGLPALLGVDDPAALDMRRMWARGGERDFLRVPIGVDDQGVPVFLDLKESAQLGMGPHGLCVGATGSGKSELLRTLVIALAATHAPTDVAMVLIDYKGGATFTPFQVLPQVAGVITNLEDDAGLIERAYTSLDGEVKRRQRVLRNAGNVANIADYAALRETEPELPPLPYLLVIIDEFGELLTYRPDFIELFLTIGRIGRSIGVHLLLSSQRVESGKLKGLDAYLSYRLGLRTFSDAESRTVLDTPDAFHLPPLPGFGYLKVDTTVYQRFKAAYVSGPYRANNDAPVVPDRPLALPYPQYNAPTAEEAEDQAVMPERSVGDTLLSITVSQLAAAAAPVHQIWLPVLPSALTLDDVAGPVAGGQRGLQLARGAGPMRAPMGLIDDPAQQRQDVWTVDLTEAGGHVAVVGAPQSGKTTLLRALVAAVALCHTPHEVALYGIDLTGAGLASLAGFPHVGGMAGRTDTERIRRTVEEVRTMLDQREALFAERGIDSVERMRAKHAAGELPELPAADVVLVVDGIGAVRGDFEELDAGLADLLQRGGGYGVHVVATMLRGNDVRIAWQSLFGIRFELRLGDPADSMIDRRLAATIQPGQRGRLLTQDQLFAQVALPRTDGIRLADGLGDDLERLAETSNALWPGDPAPPVRVLPRQLAVTLLPDAATEPERIPIGVDEAALRPIMLELFQTDQHLLVLGDGKSGKTNLLRLITNGVRARFPENQVVFAVLDPRRGLSKLLPEPYLGGYAQNPASCRALAAGVAQELAKRIPPGEDADDVASRNTDVQRVIVVVDDYDVLAAAEPQVLEPLLPYLPSARDIGLHVVLTRRVAGASRGLYEPFVLTLRETGTSGLVLAGDRGEGQLFPGVHAAAQPPGRGRWVRDGEPAKLIQTALAEAS